MNIFFIVWVLEKVVRGQVHKTLTNPTTEAWTWDLVSHNEMSHWADEAAASIIWIFHIVFHGISRINI